MYSTDPKQLAARQTEIDRARTLRFPELLARKQARMSASPLAFLRGAAPLFYELLQANPQLAAGPMGEGWIMGDAHLENFGAFSPAPSLPAGSRRRATFDLNDFDDAAWGPWRWDVLRLTTSLILAGRELGINGMQVLGLSEQLIKSYVKAAFEHVPLPPVPTPVVTLVQRVEARSRVALLNARTESDGIRRKFVRGDRYRDLPADIVAQVPEALRRYASRLPPGDAPKPEQLEVIDVAHRIAGTGSLGVLRIAALTRGKGGIDGSWIFDLKEQLTSSAALLLGPSQLSFAETVATACRASVVLPPRMLGTTELRSISMLVRRLTPQEDKLNLRHLKADDLTPLSAYLGALIGAAHARANPQFSGASWSDSECAELLDKAVTLAGIHEAAYLALCVQLRQTA